MTKEFNSIKEIEKYYDEKTNTYVFKENGCYIDLVVFNFDLYIASNIDSCNINALDIKALDINSCDINANDIEACNIDACNIKAEDIKAEDIKANDINANDISYYAVCFAYKNIKCNNIKGRRKNAKHFVFDGKLEIENG